jgi:hypothetical protein
MALAGELPGHNQPHGIARRIRNAEAVGELSGGNLHGVQRIRGRLGPHSGTCCCSGMGMSMGARVRGRGQYRAVLRGYNRHRRLYHGDGTRAGGRSIQTAPFHLHSEGGGHLSGSPPSRTKAEDSPPHSQEPCGKAVSRPSAATLRPPYPKPASNSWLRSRPFGRGDLSP